MYNFNTKKITWSYESGTVWCSWTIGCMTDVNRISLSWFPKNIGWNNWSVSACVSTRKRPKYWQIRSAGEKDVFAFVASPQPPSTNWDWINLNPSKIVPSITVHLILEWGCTCHKKTIQWDMAWTVTSKNAMHVTNLHHTSLDKGLFLLGMGYHSYSLLYRLSWESNKLCFQERLWKTLLALQTTKRNKTISIPVQKPNYSSMFVVHV